jgi:hypothetical protein
MTELTVETVERYLSTLKRQSVHVVNLTALGQDCGDNALKFSGYGTPVRVDHQVEDQFQTAAFQVVWQLLKSC